MGGIALKLCLLSLLHLAPLLVSASEEDLRIAAVIFGCSRPSHLRKTFWSLSLQDPSVLKQIQFFVSIDAHRRSKHVHRAAEEESENVGIPLTGIWRHPEPDDDSLDTRARITRHYYLGLSRVFAEPLRPTHAIVLEDDLDLSPDFLTFLLAFAGATSPDPAVGPAIVSGWNDNAAARVLVNPSATQLTGFFPGLGWILPRAVWELLEPLWPCYCKRPSRARGRPDSRRRMFPPASTAPTGWDWWLRGEFQARGWHALYPSLGRVAHRGARGSNIMAAEQRTVIKEARVADGSNALGRDEWAAARLSARVTGASYRAWLNAHDREARAADIADVHNGYLTGGRLLSRAPATEEAVFRVRFDDAEFARIAQRLKLWPHPRGFFEGRLLLPLKGGAHLLLAREAARAARRRSALASAFLADRNQSCARACARRGGECAPTGVVALNSCSALARAFGCRGGCVFESGVDIPAVVEGDAPIDTRAACVVTEDAAAIGCEGAFAHTRRACVCARAKGAGAYMAGGGRRRPAGGRMPPRRARAGAMNGRVPPRRGKDEL